MKSVILASLVELFNNNQFGFTAVRSVLERLTADTVDEFHTELMELENAKEIVIAISRLGLVPMLPDGEESPLTLTEDGTEYKYPDRASAFLSLQFETVASAPETLAIVEHVNAEHVPVESTIMPVVEIAPPVAETAPPGHQGFEQNPDNDPFKAMSE